MLHPDLEANRTYYVIHSCFLLMSLKKMNKRRVEKVVALVKFTPGLRQDLCALLDEEKPCHHLVAGRDIHFLRMLLLPPCPEIP